MRRVFRLGVVVFIGFLVGAVLATQNALVIWERKPPSPPLAEELARGTGASWETARVKAVDGVTLDGWVFTPREPNGGGVILLHGIADSREGMLEHARFLVRAGYTALTPDARGHGASGGKYISYGLLEARDLRSWADWLVANRGIQRLYGLGESMGASVLLQALAVEPRFRAVVAECPFATFEEIAYDRMWQATGAPRALFWPVVTTGFGYARIWHGFNLYRASPLEAVRATSVPVLLIHGDQDRNIEIRHSRMLHAANPKATRIWEVPGAGHVGGLATAPSEYIGVVAGWFREH